ncbi:MAG: hypothetical protein ACK4TL_04590 [Hyphomicrobiaceae bacterium]
MKRIVTALALLGAMALPAAANCSAQYKDFFEELRQSGPAKALSAEQIAIVNRQGLRAYDACNSGDENFSKNLFEQLRQAGPAKGPDFWESLRQAGPAKK